MPALLLRVPANPHDAKIFAPKFAPKHGEAQDTGAARLPDFAKDDYDLLAQRILAVALLANEQAGSLRLEVQFEKKLLGLRTVEVLDAVATDLRPPFPPKTLETLLYEHLTKQKSRSEDVKLLIFGAIGSSESPEGTVLGAAGRGLRERGLEESVDQAITTKSLFGKKHEQHIPGVRLPESTIAAAGQQPLDPVQRLLQGTEQDRPDVWKRLTAAIKQGLSLATKTQSDLSDMPDFGD